MKKEQLGIVSGGVISILCFFIYFVLIPAQVKLKSGVEIGPEFFPKLAVMVIGFSSILYILMQFYNLKSKQGSFKDGFEFNVRNYIDHIIFILAGIIFLLVANFLGFAISAIILTVFLLFLFGSQGVIKNIVIGIVYSVAVYVLFSTIVRVRFPVGIFGI